MAIRLKAIKRRKKEKLGLPIDRFGKDTHRNSIRDQRRASLGLSSAGKVRICYLKHAEPERERFSVLFARTAMGYEMIKNGGNE